MSNTICFLWQRSSCFLCIPRFFWWGEHHGWKLASPTLLPENGSLCCYPLKLDQGPGPNNPEVNVPDSFFNLLGNRCEAAEMQAETVKVEILQSGEDAKTIVESYWHQYCQMKDAEVATNSICEDAKTIVESYWQQYCQMKDAEVAKKTICEDAKTMVESYWRDFCELKKVTGLAKCLAMIWPPCGR
eukprot:symbB.v1.2.036516.t1/scaffold5178.1/size30123/2